MQGFSNACLHLPQPEFSTNPSLNRCLFKWQCSVNSHVNTLSWFWLKLSNSSALLAEGLLRRPLACVCPLLDCLCSLCFLLVKSLITPMETIADKTKAGSSTMSGCKEPYLGNLSAISLPVNSHVSWHTYQLYSVTFCQFYQGLMAVPA